MNTAAQPRTDLATALRLLAEPLRLRLLALLADGELCVCDLVSALGVPQPTASRHLAALRKAGLVEARTQGLWRYYRRAADPGAIAARLLDLLDSSRDDPMFAADRARLARTRGGCCGPDDSA